MNWITSYRYLLKSGRGEYLKFLFVVVMYVRRSALSNCFTYKFSISVGGAGRSIKSLGSWASKPKRIDSKFTYILNPIAYGLARGFLLLKHGRSSLKHASESTPFFQGWNEFEILEIHRGVFQPALVFNRSVDAASRGANIPFATHPVRT